MVLGSITGPEMSLFGLVGSDICEEGNSDWEIGCWAWSSTVGLKFEFGSIIAKGKGWSKHIQGNKRNNSLRKILT